MNYFGGNFAETHRNSSPRASTANPAPPNGSPPRWGLIAALKPDDVRRFGERVTGRNLPCASVLQGDCSTEPATTPGPHTDHHPSSGELRDGDMIFTHLSFPKVHRNCCLERPAGICEASSRKFGKGIRSSVFRCRSGNYTTVRCGAPGCDELAALAAAGSYTIVAIIRGRVGAAFSGKIL